MSSQNEQTPLLNAVGKVHVECVRLLLESGADKEAKDVVREMPSCVSHILLKMFVVY
jgi:hypothetical protein